MLVYQIDIRIYDICSLHISQPFRKLIDSARKFDIYIYIDLFDNIILFSFALFSLSRIF